MSPRNRKVTEESFSVRVILRLAKSPAITAAVTLAYVIVLLLLQFVIPGPDKEETPSLESRIDRLADSLTAASETITEIEGEVEARLQLVEELRQDAETYERLAELNREEVEAVTQVIEGELEEDQAVSLWREILLNIGFLILGSLLTVIIATWRERKHRRSSDP